MNDTARHATTAKGSRLPAPLAALVAARMAAWFRALGDPTRIRILHALAQGELCNGDLAALTGLSESAMSHQMHELRLLDLVRAERRGRMVFYQLADGHISHVFNDTLRHVLEDGGG